MRLIQEFREFAMKGNVIDMAVGIIIGGAFGKIVNSIVGDIIMPVVGALAGKGSFGSQFLYLGDGEKPVSIQAAKDAGVPYIAWGPFIQTTLDFLILAFAIFMMIKIMNKASSLAIRRKEAEVSVPAAPPEDIQLLREIRDALLTR